MTAGKHKLLRCWIPRQGQLLAAVLLLMPLASYGQFCTECIDIRTQQRIYRPADQVQILLDVQAAAVPATRVDAYVAAIMPDNRMIFIREMPGWNVIDLNAAPITIESLQDKAIGQYQLYFVLALPGGDPLDSNNWVAAKTVELALLPQDWQISQDPPGFVRSSGLPPLVTHGGGAINGQIVTNSLQALNHSYDRGQRFFELDISWTSDGELVLMHDWDRTYRRLFSQASGVPSLAQFKQLTMNFGLKQLSLPDLLGWLEEHDDARIITDIKDDNLAGLELIASSAGNSFRRFIPQIYSLEEFAPAAALGYSNIIFTLYRTAITNTQLLEFVNDNSPVAVTMPVSRAITDTIAMSLNDRGVRVYAHTVNFPELYEYLQSRGVYGIYSDNLLPETP